jgi:hypothetical protein
MFFKIDFILYVERKLRGLIQTLERQNNDAASLKRVSNSGENSIKLMTTRERKTRPQLGSMYRH